MRAIVLTAYGDASNLELVKRPRLKPGPNEVKVRMAGAGVSPVDWKLRSGALDATMPLTFPVILGREVSGEVVEVGDGVTGFSLGARVMGLVNSGYAAFVIATTDAWAHVPATMDLVEAAALPLALLTGAQLIEEAMRARPGDVLLVTGALGNVGRVAVFVAKSHGATVWAGVRSAQKSAAETLGADGIVALDRDSEVAALPALDGIADTVGGETITKLLSKLKPAGTLGSVVGQPAGAQELGITVRLIRTHADAQRLATLARAVADTELAMPSAVRIPLARAGEGQTLAQHQSAAKVILTGRPRKRLARTEYLTREQVLKLLSDGELTDFSRGSATALRNGEEYLDLEHLARGVQHARTGVITAAHALARKSVHEDTWRKILRQLSAAPL